MTRQITSLLRYPILVLSGRLELLLPLIPPTPEVTRPARPHQLHLKVHLRFEAQHCLVAHTLQPQLGQRKKQQLLADVELRPVCFVILCKSVCSFVILCKD